MHDVKSSSSPASTASTREHTLEEEDDNDDEIPDSENLCKRISLFSRYQGTTEEDKVLNEYIESLPEGLNIRWLKTTDFSNGYRDLQPCQSDTDAQALPDFAIFRPEDALSFKRLFRSTFPEHKSDLRMVVITRETKVIASGVLYLHEENATIGDIRLLMASENISNQHDAIDLAALKSDLIGGLKAIAMVNSCTKWQISA